MWAPCTTGDDARRSAGRSRRARRSRPACSSRARARAPGARGRRRSRVSGTPHWLLKLPSGLSTGPERAQHRGHHLLGRGLAVGAGDRGHRDREARPGDRRRAARARGVVSSTRIVGHRRRQVVRQVVDDQARRARAPPRRRRKAWPSRFGPRIAKKALPMARWRLSMLTPVTGTPRSPATSAALGAADHVLDAQAAPCRALPLRRARRARPAPPRGRRTAAPRCRRSGRSRAPCPRSPRRRPRAPRPIAPCDRRAGGPAMDSSAARGRGAGCPASISAEDRLRVLAARVVGGDHRPGRASARRDAAHDRALAAVAVAAAAEDHGEPRAGRQQLARRARARARARRACARSPRRPGTAGRPRPARSARAPCAHAGERPADPRGSISERQADADGPEEIHHVVLADERRRRSRSGPGARRSRARMPPMPDSHRRGRSSAGGAQAEGQDPHPGIGGRAARTMAAPAGSSTFTTAARRGLRRSRADRRAGPWRRGRPRACCGNRDGPGSGW